MTKIEEKLKEVRKRVLAIMEAADEGNPKLYGHLGAQLINFIETDLVVSQREEIESKINEVTGHALDYKEEWHEDCMTCDILAALKES